MEEPKEGQDKPQRPSLAQGLRPAARPAEHSVPRNKFLFCASGRKKSEVQHEILEMRLKKIAIERKLHAEKVEICRKDWDSKYRGEYPFIEENAYVALVPGEKLNQDLCQDLYNVTNILYELDAELTEPSDARE